MARYKMSKPLKAKLTPEQRVERYLDQIGLERLEHDRNVYDMEGWGDPGRLEYVDGEYKDKRDRHGWRAKPRESKHD